MNEKNVSKELLSRCNLTQNWGAQEAIGSIWVKAEIMIKNVFLLLCFFPFLANSQAQNPSWSVKKLWHTSDVQRNGEKGIEFVADYVVNNMMGKELQGFVMIYDANKQYIKNPSASSNYRFSSNSIFTCSEKLRSNYVSTSVTNCKAFLPYSQLPRTTGNAVYYYAFFLRDATDNKWLSGNSDYGQFSLTWPFKRELVKTWSDVYGKTTTYYKKFNDGIVEVEKRTICWSICEKCGGHGKVIDPIGNYRRNCYTCLGTGKCQVCKGLGYTTNKSSYLEIDTRYYSNGAEAFQFHCNNHLQSYGSLGSLSRLGIDYIINANIEDRGTYWQYGDARISKDLSTLYYDGKTYNSCSESEYERLYAKELKEIRERNASNTYVSPVTTVPITGGGTSSGSNSSRRECRRCLGTGRLPFSSDRYTTRPVNNTSCGKIDHSSCNYVSCHECHKNHCASLGHVTCDKCYGRGYLE